MFKLAYRSIKISLIFITLSIFACTHKTNNDFIKISEHAQFKIISFNTSANNIEDGDLLEFKCLSLKSNTDTLIADSTKLNELFNDTITFNSSSKSDLLKVLAQLQEGDSCLALFYGNKQANVRISTLNSLSQKDTIYTYIKLKHIYKGEAKMAYQLEENAIARYITFSKNKWLASENGIYYRIIKSSEHPKLVANDVIKIVYKGYFLNNQVFDNYAEINPYFEHIVGTQNQLIRGMEIAIDYMSYGSEAEFIFPSSLAFGESGSATGIVAAYKPVLYKVKVLDKAIL
jgi:FKBP-type peptidyl-prolyl cis-trans isomerase